MVEIRKWTVMILAIALVAANCSCSRYVRVPRDAYRDVNAGDAQRWRVETEDRTVYVISRFTLTDSTLVIKEFDPAVESPGTTYPLATIMPYTLDLEDVRSIEKWVEVSENDAVTATAFAVVAVIVAALILLAHAISDIPLD